MENRNIIGMVLVFIVVVFFMLMYRVSTRPKVIKEKSLSTKFTPYVEPKNVSQSYTYSPPAGTNAELAREIAEANEKANKTSEQIQKAGSEWLKKMVNDPSVATFTREIYRMRNIPSMADGSAAVGNGDFYGARENFMKAFEDPNSTPVGKYIAAQYLMAISRQLKDYEGYFKWGKEMGKLLSEEDLTCLDKEKSKEFLNRITEKEMYFKARKNASMQEKIVEYFVSQMDPKLDTPEMRASILKQVKESIKSVEKEVLG